MVSYYNEIDPYAAQWLRNLIANKLIADGDVDERSIRDVAAADLHGYTQCHFFAGIGVWSYALRLAGWSDDRPVWTGSCPCQPFSAAGQGKGFDDDRHLWPEFHRLIAECRPPVVFGEQVASKDGLGWLDTVHTDMEASGYAVGAVDLCAAGIGAPHIRQRLWFVGERLDDTAGARHVGALAGAEGEARDEARLRLSGEGRGSGGLADAPLDGRRQGVEDGGRLRSGDSAEGTAGRSALDSDVSGGLADAERGERRPSGLCGLRQADGKESGGASAELAGNCDGGGLADASSGGRQHEQSGQPSGVFLEEVGNARNRAEFSGHSASNGGLADACNNGPQGWVRGGANEERQTLDGSAGRDGADRGSSPTDGQWRDADWLHCRDGKWRPVEPGTFPLAHGAPARVGRLRAYGNAIVPQVAAEVIGAYLDARP